MCSSFFDMLSYLFYKFEGGVKKNLFKKIHFSPVFSWKVGICHSEEHVLFNPDIVLLALKM